MNSFVADNIGFIDFIKRDLENKKTTSVVLIKGEVCIFMS